jgi:hypothetical protein
MKIPSSGSAPQPPGPCKVLFATLLFAGPAMAEPLLYEKAGLYETGAVIGVKAGADFSSPFNELGTSPAVELEVGWLLPGLARSFQIFASGQWAGPTGEDELPADPRLPGDGVAAWKVDQQHLRIAIGTLYRIPINSTIRPYVSLGGRAWLLKTTMEGEAGGQAFGTYTEKSTEYGIFGGVGGEWHTEYGALLLELQGGYAAHDRTVFESSAVGTLALQLGWRFFL